MRLTAHLVATLLALLLCGAALPVAANPALDPDALFDAGAIQSIDGADTASARAWAQEHGGVYVWDTMNNNRRNYSGPIFHVYRPEGGAFRVVLRFASIGADTRVGQGDFADGQPAELVLRLFDDRDRSVFATPIGQREAGWYEAAVVLDNAPPGRYRLSMVGYHNGMAVAAMPQAPIGVAGGVSIGLEGGGDYYFYVPEGARPWGVVAATADADQTLSFFDEAGNMVRQRAMPAVPIHRFTQLERIEFADAPGGQAWRLRHEGQGRVRLGFRGDVVGILWPSPEHARAAGRRVDTVGHWRIVHQWQRPMAQWLTERTRDDFEVPQRDLPPIAPEHLPDNAAIRLARALDGLNKSISLLRHNQIIDPASPDVGLFSEPAGEGQPAPGTPVRPRRLGDPRSARTGGRHSSNVIEQIGYVQAMVDLYAFSGHGVNPYYLDPAVRHRAIAGLLQILLDIPIEQYNTDSFPRLRMLGSTAAVMYPHLPEALAEPVRAALVEMFGRVAHFDSYLSNQGLVALIGTKYAADIANDAELKRYYERRIAAFFSDRMLNTNHGQTPAGYYQEGGGFDGAYNTYSATVIASLWNMTHDPRYYRSLERNWELIRHMAVRNPGGALDSARNWNTRTDSNAFRWHRQRYGVPVPGVATFWGDAVGYDGDEPWTLADRARESIRNQWGKIPGPGLNGTKWWAGGYTNGYLYTGPYAMPQKLACEEPGPFARAFGADYDRNFFFGRVGPWYIVLYGGDISRNGDAGSTLATLWHDEFGALINGDTRVRNDAVEKRRKDGEELILAFADAWQAGGQRVSTEKSFAAFRGDAGTGRFTATIRPDRSDDPAWELTRHFVLSPQRFETSAALGAGAPAGWAVYLPLTDDDRLALTPLDAQGEPARLAPGQKARLSGFRWSTADDDAPGGQRTITLRFEEPTPVESLLRGRGRHIVRVDFGQAPGRFIVE